MSLAKNKKIQSILAQASSDSEEDETRGGGSAFADFSTMKQKVNKKKSNKNTNTTTIASTPTKVVEVVENAAKKVDEEEKKSSHPAPAKNKNATKGSSSAPKPTKAAATQGSKASVKKGGGSGGGDTRTDRKKEAHKKKKDTEEEEERLLNDILSGQGNGEGSEDHEGGASSYHQPGRTGTDVMSLMYTADRKYLDYRHEQAESFGKHAIEDLTGKNMKRLGYVVPKIARTPFSSPNLGNGTWTVLAKPEGAADLVEVKGTSKPTLFSIDATSSEYLKAHHALQFAVETSMGNTEALLKTWQAHPHHLPTVLQLASTFQTLGDVSKTSEFMDIALHLVGNLFSSSRGFNLIDPPTKRQIPFDFDPNKPVFTALSRGVHHVMGKSFAKTSHEICKVLLSLNEHDPCGAALLWDYTAVRAREYMSVVELHHTVVGTALRVAGMPTVPSPLVESMVGLPSLYFSAALSRHVLHTSSTRSAASSSTGGSTAIKGNRTPLGKCNTDLLVRSGGGESPLLSGAQNAFPAKGKMPLCGAMSARDAAITAVALFPQSAVDLAAALGEPVAEEPWSSLAFEVDDLKRTSDVFASRCESPLHHIFAQRHSEMWKPVDRIGLLRDAVREVNKSGLISAIHGVGVSPIPSPPPAATSPVSSGSSSTPLDAEVVARASLSHVRELLFLIDEQSDALQSRYGTIPEHYITGKMDGAIPRELLEAMQAEDDQNAMGGRVERLSQQDMMLLERYEAAFGPIEIPGEDRMLPSERLTFYSAQLEDHIRRLGDTYNPISLFFRTILPWNDVREMALRTAFGNANTEDPEVVARRVRREYERQVMDEADALPDGDDAMGPR